MLPIRKFFFCVGLFAAMFAMSVPTVSLSAQTQQNAAQIRVTGTVLDDSGQPMIGASVLVKGTTTGVVTDQDGKYELNVPSGSTIEVSYIGFTSKDISVTKAGAYDVTLSADNDLLSEVVVVGYGTQKKVNLSGAVSSVNGDVLTSRPATDALAALQGTMSGIEVLRSSGKPGSETTAIRIRGLSSANATSTLVLIDGVESDMSLLNPNDIESVSVLKDAAAAAIYGARAAAGVVLVTTKNGSSDDGKARVSYNGYFALGVPTAMPERVTAWEEQTMIDEGRLNTDGKREWTVEQASWTANANFSYRPNPTSGRWDLFGAENWVYEGTKRVTTQQQHSVSVSGGSKRINYYISGNFYDKKGILKYGPDSNNRYNVRAKINSEICKYVDLGVQVSYDGQFIKTNPYGAESILQELYQNRGRQPIYQPEQGEDSLYPEYQVSTIYNGDLQANAIDLMKNGGAVKNQTHNIIGKANLRVKNLVKGLVFDFAASRKYGFYNYEASKRTLYYYGLTEATLRRQTNNPNSYTRKMNYDYHDNLEAIVRYDGQFGKHNLSVMAGYTYEQYRKEQLSATAKSLLSNDFFSLNYYDASDPTNTSIGDEVKTWALMSAFGRINYNFDERYLFEANIRYDGSSRLAPESRWQAFPSFSGAWRISNEKWFNVKPISNLKFRASWGQLGNGAVLGLYDYIALIESDTEMGNKNYYQSTMASKSKTWETISTTNIGLDLGMFENRLTLTADYYWKTNDNMLASLELPSLVGIGVPDANVGKLKTWGWEIEIGYRNHAGDFNYGISANLSDSQNCLERYDGRNSINEGIVNLLEGYPINTVWGYQTDGYWSSREEYLQYKQDNPGYQSFQDAKIGGGDIKYVAQGKADHTLGAGGGTPEDSGDLVLLGNTNARYLYGFTLNLSWRGFDFSAMFQGTGKRNVVVATDVICPFTGTTKMPWTIHRDYWTEDNQDASLPRLTNKQTYNYLCSDKWLQDASFLRLKNVQLGYSIPFKKINQFRVYISGQDVLTFSKMLSCFDPECANIVTAYYYPYFANWALGLNITF